MTTKPSLPLQSLALAPLLFAVPAASQQPQLDLSSKFVSRQQTQGSLAWSTYSRVGDVASAWSTNQDLADGMPFLQYRVRMTANATTGAVPWLDSLFVPVQ